MAFHRRGAVHLFWLLLLANKSPLFPEPTQVFSRRGCQLSVAIGTQRYQSNCRWISSALYRTVTVRDAMS